MYKYQLSFTAFLFLCFSSFVFGQNITPVVEWQRCFGSTGHEEAQSAIITSDSGYVFVGETNYSENNGDLSGITNHGRGDIWVVKLSASRTIQWQTLLGGSEMDFPKSIIQTKDGGYMILGGQVQMMEMLVVIMVMVIFGW